jgi:hypothetical protein
VPLESQAADRGIATKQEPQGEQMMASTGETDGFQETDESLAARYEISFDGKRYAYRIHHYDTFRDALRYAIAEHAKVGFQHDLAFRPRWQAEYHPTDEDENLMKLHGIAYVEGHYLYGGYRYGQLGDAIDFAAGHPNL